MGTSDAAAILNNAEKFPRTDAGNAELIASLYEDTLRFDHRRDQWKLWKNNRWQVDQTGEVRQWAKRAARKRLAMAEGIDNTIDRDAQIAWARKSESKYNLDAATTLAQSTDPLSDSGDNWDSDPFLLGVANGVVNLRTGQLRDTRCDDRITMYLDVPFRSTAQCPRFHEFLYSVFQHKYETVQYIQKAIGYCLTGDVSEQCFFLCYGSGANGKSTLLELVRCILGPYGYNLPFSALEKSGRSQIPNDVAGMVSKRFVTASEANEGTQLNEARIKWLTGKETLKGRFLYKEYFEFQPTAKVWLAVNHKPVARDDSHGYWRRVHLIPFGASFSGTDCDPNLLEKLLAESEGILAWAVQGCLLWQSERLGRPPVVEAATDEYRKESDTVAQFIEECCEVCPEGFFPTSDLQAAYKQWMRDAGESPLETRPFNQRLKDRGFLGGRSSDAGGNRVRGWWGIKAKVSSPPSCVLTMDSRTASDSFSQ